MQDRSLTRGQRLIAIGCVLEYDRLRRALADARYSTMYGSSKPDGTPTKGSVGHPSERKACKLVELDDSAAARIVQAVDQAWLELDEPALKAGIEINIIDRVPYEYLDAPCGRQTFYNRRNKFLRIVAGNLEI